MGRQVKICKETNNGGERPVAYNENGAFGMAMIELDRAIESPFYRQSGRETQLAKLARGIFPLTITRIARHFHHALKPASGGRFIWKHNEANDNCCDDSSHGALSMRFIEALRENQARLAPLTPEPILLDSNDLRSFANTFIHMTASGNVADTIDGSDPSADYNEYCYGWLDLSRFDRRIYDRCREMILRIRDGAQPALTQSSFAALLANGR